MTSFFEHQKVSYKKSYLRNIISIARMDGNLDLKEIELIFKIAEKRGLKKWQTIELIADQSPYEIFVPNHLSNRLTLLYDLMLIIFSDGKIDPREEVFFLYLVGILKIDQSIALNLKDLFVEGEPSTDQWQNWKDSILHAVVL